MNCLTRPNPRRARAPIGVIISALLACALLGALLTVAIAGRVGVPVPLLPDGVLFFTEVADNELDTSPEQLPGEVDPPAPAGGDVDGGGGSPTPDSLRESPSE